MRKCAGAAEIHILVEKELSTADAENLNGHMRTCERCSRQFQRFSRMKGLIESSLKSRAGCHDTSAEIVRRALESESVRPSRSATRVFLKRALIGVGASLAVIAFALFLFARLYFQRTFSYELNDMVVRCSDGLQIAHDGAEWRQMRVGDRLEESARIRSPANARSFMAFDGIRLLTDGQAEFATEGRRKISLRNGEMFIATAERDEPLALMLGTAHVSANGAAFRLARSGGTGSVGVASGTVDLILADGSAHELAAGQTADLSDGASDFEIAHGEVGDPFAVAKASTIDRIKRRFAKVISRYIPDYQLIRQVPGRPGAGDMLKILTDPDDMYQFASYMPGARPRYAQAGGVRLDDYYNTLFAPSKRTITIGRQRIIPLEDGKLPANPAWSHDGSMIAYIENKDGSWPTVLKVARLDDLEHPWVISQDYETVLPMFPLAWAPDNRHVLFMAVDEITFKEKDGKLLWRWGGPYRIKIAPIDPAEGRVRDFFSPYSDIELPIQLHVPVGKTISPQILKLPWGDAVLCVNWGNIAYIPIEQDGQAVARAPGMFLTDFSPRKLYVALAMWSPSGNKIIFLAAQNLTPHPINVYILYDVEDILDGFALPPRTVDDPRIKRIAPSKNDQFPGGFSFDESLVFFQEDVKGKWNVMYPMFYGLTDLDLFYANALYGEPGMETQIHLPDSQVAMTPSPEGNRIAYCNYDIDWNREGDKVWMDKDYQLRVVSFDIEADIDVDLGGVLIDNSGTNLIVPPGTLEENFGVRISTPFSIGEEAELGEGETTFFAMRLIDSQGLEKPRFIEPMTLTIRYTDDEVEGLDEGMLEIYYYDETDPENPVWVPLGGTVDPDYNEITVEIRHFSKFSVGGEKLESGAHPIRYTEKPIGLP